MTSGRHRWVCCRWNYDHNLVVEGVLFANPAEPSQCSLEDDDRDVELDCSFDQGDYGKEEDEVDCPFFAIDDCANDKNTEGDFCNQKHS